MPDDEHRPGHPEKFVGTPAADAKPDADTGLERPIQEHLGKQLRSTYHHVMAEKPTFLGESAVPPQFDGLIQKLEARDRQRNDAIHDKAVAAVETALQEIVPGPSSDEKA